MNYINISYIELNYDLKNIEIKAIPKPILEIYKALNG